MLDGLNVGFVIVVNKSISLAGRHIQYISRVVFLFVFLGESVGVAPPEVVHQLESLPHVRLVEGVHPSIHRVLLGVRGTGGTRRGRCGHQTGKTWEAVSGWLEIDDDPTVRSSVSWVTRGGWDRDVTPDTSDDMDQTDTCSVTVVSIVLHHRKGSSVRVHSVCSGDSPVGSYEGPSLWACLAVCQYRLFLNPCMTPLTHPRSIILAPSW